MPILTNSVRYIDIGGAVYVYVGGYGEERGDGVERRNTRWGAII